MPDPSTSAIQGFAAADALSWQARWQRATLLPDRRLTRLTKLQAWGFEARTANLMLPYHHSTPLDTIDHTGPSSATEWLTVATRSLRGQNLAGSDTGDHTAVWRELAAQRSDDPEHVRARIGVSVALRRLRAGVEPPASGRFNPHYFDDLSLVYGFAAAVSGVQDPASAATQVAQVTHGFDGVWCAAAAAAFFTVLMEDRDPNAAAAAAVSQLPEDSWSRNLVGRHLEVARTAATQLEYVTLAQETLTDHVYSYPAAAPDCLGALLGHALVARSAEDLLMGVNCNVQATDVLTPLVGGAAAALYGTEWAPTRYQGLDAVLQGANVRSLAGTKLAELAA